MLDFADYKVPRATQESLTRYIEQGIAPDGFLEAVLCNDLMGAVAQADNTNFNALKDITGWVYMYAPPACWGTQAKHLRWMLEHPAKSKIGPKELEPS
jgi:hypothetical protein